jgi:intein/homing endonuclease
MEKPGSLKGEKGTAFTAKHAQGLSTTARKSCRLCNSSKIVPIFSLGEQYVNDFVDKGVVGIKAPLELILCENCSLLQLRHTAPQEILYARFYWYHSGFTRTIRDDLKQIAEVSSQMVKLKQGDVALDIGANDGTLLSNYPKGVTRVGCEPANNLVDELKKNCDLVIHDFWTYDAYNKLGLDKKAKVITAIGMFYDMEDPNQFVADAAKALAEDGIFVAQLMCLKNMLENNDVGNICFKPDTLLLGDNKKLSDIAIKDKTFGANQELNEIKNTMQRNYDGEMIKINPLYLDNLVCTPEHPIQIIKKENMRRNCNQLKPKSNRIVKTEWVNAKDVKRGDFLTIPRLKENVVNKLDLSQYNKYKSRAYRGGLMKLELNEETAWLIGLYTAEGHLQKFPKNHAFVLTLHEKESYFVDKVKAIMEKLGYKTTIYHQKASKGISVVVYCSALALALHDWCGKRAIEKRIPDFIMTATNNIRTSYLKGLFDGDGYRKGNQMHIHTSSKVLALQTQLLVASLGGMMGLSHADGYDWKIKGKPVKIKESWQLRGKTLEISKIFGYAHIGKSNKKYVTTKDYIAVPVLGVQKELYKGKVCNVETEDNTYLVSNAIVHNCHEHLEYYSLEALKYLFEKNGLEIFKVEENAINGGSYRLFARRYKNGSIPLNEKFTKKDYMDFYKRIEENKKLCVDFIKQEVKKGKRVYVYGASTKGNVILQYYGLTPELIVAAAEKSKDKIGKYTVGTMIPIVDEDDVRDKADYFFLLPYSFLKEFMEKEKDWRAKGGKFIVPLPNFRVV